jgi:hypothetical protein
VRVVLVNSTSWADRFSFRQTVWLGVSLPTPSYLEVDQPESRPLKRFSTW